MDKSEFTKTLQIMINRFGHDVLISLATLNGDIPSVCTVNSYYEKDSF